MDRVVGGVPAAGPIPPADDNPAKRDPATAIRDDLPRMAAALAHTTPRGWLPTQAIILALVAVLVIPGILFAGYLLTEYARSERARYTLEGIGVARGAATVLDRDLQGLQTTLQTLATSTFLAAGDIEHLYAQARRVKSFSGVDIALRTIEGQQIFNTRREYGTVLPVTPYSVDHRAIETGEPVVTNVVSSVTSGRPIIAIVLAVASNDGTRYLMHVSTLTDHFFDVIKDAAPSHWTIGVGDANGVYVTRSENHAEFTGKPGVPSYIAMADQHEGSFIGSDAFGDPVLVSYTHTAIGNWLVAANIKQSIVAASLRTALLNLATFGAVILLLSSLVALWLWRFVARPLESLAAASRAVGTRHPPARVETHLREFAEVQDALSFAAEQVRAQNELLEAKVEERTQELAQVNKELIAQMTARERAEGELRQFQRIEAVGQLTGGIAHDFNNMLSIVLSSLSLIQRRLDRGDTDIQRFVNSALEGVNRAKTLTSRLLAFSRLQPLAPDVLDANRLVSGMSELLRRTLGEAIHIETVLGGGLWKTFADAPQLENAIVNLCINARDAMPDGGRLTIETANAFLDEEYCRANEGTTPGQYVLLAVTDTGIGMDAETVEHAFDPFFTTKKTGMGTGLGLSQVYGFVKQSKGHIKIYSERGHGTTIKIYLPRYYGEDSALAADPMAGRRDARLPAGSLSEVILVVEDEERLRQLTSDSLRELGYTVYQAGHAREALELLHQHPEICLLFTDIVMPDVNGRKLADEVQARRPDIRVLYTTGFTRNAVVHNGILDTGVNFIAKPFTMEDLAAKVRAILADVRTSDGAGGWN